MIKITSYYPFQNLLRVTQEFYEDKAVVKLTALTFEREFEFEYKDVTIIIDEFKTDYNQTKFSFWFLLVIVFLLAIFRNFIYTHLILLRAEQALYTLGLLLYFTSFKKNWWLYFLDKNDNTLAAIKQTQKNRDRVSQITESIKNKAENLREYTSTDTFPDGKHEFEHVEYDLSSLSKTTERVYEQEIVGYRQTPFSESVYSIQYDRLSGKVYHGKSGNDYLAGWLVTLGTLLTSVYGGFFFGFAIPFHIHIPISVLIAILNTILGISIIGVVSLPLNLIKQEIIGLYNKNGSIEYSTRVNRKNKNEVEKIIEFIQSKIPAEEKR